MPYMTSGSLSYDIENGERSVVNYEASYSLFDADGIAGLGALDPEAMEGLTKLDPRVVAIIAEEMKEPDQRSTLLELLRSPDPVKAVADQMAAELMDEMGLSSHAGMDGLGKKKRRGFKKLIKKIGKPVVKIAKKYGATIVSVAGAVLAPFTGGASLAAAAVVTTGIKVYQVKKAAKDAKAMAKKEAGALEAEAQTQIAALEAQVASNYSENVEFFTQIGFPPEKWNAMSLDEKLKVYDDINNGRIKIPASAPPVTAVPPPPQGAPPSLPTMPGAMPPGFVSPVPAYIPAPGAPPPEVPAGAVIEIVVEGVKSGPFPTLEAAVKAALASAGPGDRFEVTVGGTSTGLHVKTTDGYKKVPDDISDKVRAMPKEEIAAAVAKVEKKGAFPWWLIAIPAVAVAAAA